jgi:hypothetical protein
MVDEIMPHNLRGNPKNNGPILPLRGTLVDQFQVGLVDERRGLQSVVNSFLPHVPGRHLPRFAVNGWHELGGRLLISLGQNR